MRRFIDQIDRNITEGVGLRDAAQLVEFKRGDDGDFEVQYYEESTIEELAAGHSFVFIIKGDADYQGTPLVQATSVVESGSGTTKLYTFTPDFNTTELGDYLVDGTVGQRVADTAALLAITGKANGYIVAQTDTGQYWTLTDDTTPSAAASWTLSTMKAYRDALLEIVWTNSAGKELSTNTVTARIHSDLYRGNDGLPTSASPGFYDKAATDALLEALRLMPSLPFFGTLVDEQQFGYFKVPYDGEIHGVQLSAQVAATGADVQVDLFLVGTGEQTKIATLTAVAKYEETIFATALPVSADDEIVGIVKQVGSTEPGRYLNMNLLFGKS